MCSRQTGPIQAFKSKPARSVLHAARAARPDCAGEWSLQLPGEASRMVITHCLDENNPDHWFPLRMIWINPYTAELVSSRTFGDCFITWIYDLHWSLLLGKTGHVFVRFLGLLLMLSLSTGLYLWWPNPRGLKKALTIKRKASSERLIFDLHKTFGFYTVPILFVLAFSGMHLVFPEY